jgi:hypothetical protein
MPATPQKVEDHLALFRTHLNRIIEMWERSGQGDGGYDDGEEDSEVHEGYTIVDQASPTFGSLAGRTPRALDGHAAFLHGKPSYLLFFWEVADRHQLLRSALQRFDEDAGASDASSAPSAISGRGTRRRRRQDPEELDGQSDDIVALSESLRFVAESERARAVLLADREDVRYVRRRADALQDQAREYRRMYAETDDPDSSRAKFYQDELKRIELEIATIQQEVRTPTRQNTTPRS